MNPNSQNSLQLLGIQTWQSNQPLPGAKYVESFHALELLDEDRIAIGRLLLPVSHHASNATDQLLSAIIFSLNCTKIELGQGEKACFVEGADIPAFTIDLAELLKSPLTKRKLWKQLQPLLNSL